MESTSVLNESVARSLNKYQNAAFPRVLDEVDDNTNIVREQLHPIFFEVASILERPSCLQKQPRSSRSQQGP